MGSKCMVSDYDVACQRVRVGAAVHLRARRVARWSRGRLASRPSSQAIPSDVHRWVRGPPLTPLTSLSPVEAIIFRRRRSTLLHPVNSDTGCVASWVRARWYIAPPLPVHRSRHLVAPITTVTAVLAVGSIVTSDREASMRHAIDLRMSGVVGVGAQAGE